MKKRKINYIKHWASCGTCYSQTIHVSKREYEHLLLALDAEKANPNNDDHYFKLYIKQPLERKGNIIFINLTQRDFFNKFLKAKLLDRNTCLQID